MTMLFIAINAIAFSQNKKITGIVFSEDSVLISRVQITLINKDGTQEERKLHTATITDNLGNFKFDELKNGKYILEINEQDFQNFISPEIILNDQNPNSEQKIFLKKQKAKELEEVKISVKIPFVTQKIDRTVINPEALIANAGGTAFDVLNNSPGIMIDENAAIRMKGKSGVTILVDDKPLYLSGSELENYLRSLPASSIKQIELMPNPPAKYDASGNSGVINIITKRSKLKGFSGNVSANYGQGKYAKTNDNLNLNFNSKKISLYTTVNFVDAENYHDLTLIRRFKNPDSTPKSSFTQNTYLKTLLKSYNIKLGLDYYITEKSILGFEVKPIINNLRRPRYNNARIEDAENELQNVVIADNYEKTKFVNGTYTLNFRHQFANPEQNLTIDADYINYNSSTTQLYKNYIFNPDQSLEYQDIQNGDLQSKINILTFKSDYVHPLKDNSKLSFGAKIAQTKTDNNADYTITQNGITNNNDNLSNHFYYNEIISAAYMNYSKTFKKFDVQAGIRFESTRLNGKQLGNSVNPYSEFNNNYSSLFPTVFLNYKIDSLGTKNLNFSYGRRVDRPFYKDLNPFSSPLDQYTIYEGNPFLKPTFSHNFNLIYSYKDWFSTTLSYAFTNDDISETIEIKNGIYYSRPNNIGKSKLYNLSFQTRNKPFNWLTSNVYTEFNYSEYKSLLYNQNLHSKGFTWNINVVNSIQFSKDWIGEVKGEYTSDFISAQLKFGDFGHLSVGVLKKLWNDKATIKLNLSDIFHTNRIRGTINNLENTEANWYGPRDTRVASVTFSYRFGSGTGNKKKYEGTGSETEQNRIKS